MHQAGDKMMARARKSLWWPLITRDVNNAALTCKPCQEYKPSNLDEPLRNHEVATYPFQFVHMDLGEVNGKHFLIAVDQYSGFPQIYECGKTAKTEQVIAHTINLFENFWCQSQSTQMEGRSSKASLAPSAKSGASSTSRPPPTCPGQMAWQRQL